MPAEKFEITWPRVFHRFFVEHFLPFDRFSRAFLAVRHFLCDEDTSVIVQCQLIQDHTF